MRDSIRERFVHPMSGIGLSLTDGPHPHPAPPVAHPLRTDPART
jgi:hypothetical protein